MSRGNAFRDDSSLRAALTRLVRDFSPGSALLAAAPEHFAFRGAATLTGG
jgi:hypothetical protein